MNNTPEGIIALCEKIDEAIPEARLFNFTGNTGEALKKLLSNSYDAGWEYGSKAYKLLTDTYEQVIVGEWYNPKVTIQKANLNNTQIYIIGGNPDFFHNCYKIFMVKNASAQLLYAGESHHDIKKYIHTISQDELGKLHNLLQDVLQKVQSLPTE